MPTYNGLTDEQKADVSAYDTFLRGTLRSLVRVMAKSEPDRWQAFAAASVDPVIASLADGESIPNSTGLAGAKPLTKAEFLALQTLMRGLLAMGRDNIAIVTKAVGVNGE